MVLESGLLQEREERYELTGPLPPLAIPTTLHDSLMARLDRLATVKGLAQLGATLGREFSYELLQAVSPWDEATLQQGLHQLVEAEFLYQRGLPPQATYLFKHALIQDAAYQSLLQSTRQQYHQRIAQVLEAHFPEICRDPARAAGPSLHGGGPQRRRPSPTGSGRASAPSSARPMLEAIGHLTKGAGGAPDPAGHPRARPAGTCACRSPSARRCSWPPRARRPRKWDRPTPGRASCASRWGRPRSSSRCCGGCGGFTSSAGGAPDGAGAGGAAASAWPSASPDPALLCWRPTTALGQVLFCLGEAARLPARTWSRGLPSTTPSSTAPRPSATASTSAVVVPVAYAAWALWLLGYPDQALARSHEALTLAQELSHPFSLAACPGLCCPVSISSAGRPRPPTTGHEAAIALAAEQGFLPTTWRVGRCLPGLGAGAGRGRGRGGDGPDAPGHWPPCRPRGQSCVGRISCACWPRPYGNGRAGRGRAHACWPRRWRQWHSTGERFCEAELYRLKGELLLAQSPVACRRRRKPVFTRPSTLPAASRRSPWSCGRP